MQKFLRYLMLCSLPCLTTAAWAQPANNECSGAIAMTMNANGSCAVTTNVVTTAATISNPVLTSGTFCANASGNDDVWYSFTTSATQTGAILTVSNIVATLGTATNIGVALYTGTCAGLTTVSCVASGITTTTNLSVGPNTTYYLRVWTGSGSNSATFTLCLQEGPVPPNCATGLLPATGASVALICAPPAASPSSANFSWTAPASGPAPTSYKFYLGTTTPVFLGSVAGTGASVNGLLPNTSYNWYVVPNNGSDAIGCNVNNTFTTQAEPTCVPNNACTGAITIGTAGNGGTVNGTTVGASISFAAEVCGGATGIADDDVWFRFTTDGNGGDVTIALTAAGATLDAVIQVYSGTCGSLVNVGCADAGASAASETAVLTGLAAGTTYFVRVYGYGGFSATTPTNGTFTLTTSGTGLDGSIVLPVTLTSFDAKIQDQDAVISWKVQSELNNKGFEIQRSADGRTFTGIGFVNSRGNTNSERSYSFTDPRVVAGVYHYYRLKQIDLDDRFTHSSIARVRLSAPGSPSISVFPNPAQHILQVTFDRVSSVNTTVQVIDIRGRSIQQQQMPGGANKTSINVERLPAGVYFVRISTADHTEQVRFVKD